MRTKVLADRTDMGSCRVSQLATVFAFAVVGMGALAHPLSRKYSYLSPPPKTLIEEFADLTPYARAPAAARLTGYLPERAPLQATGRDGVKLATRTAQNYVQKEWLDQTEIGQSTKKIESRVSGGVSARTGQTQHRLDFRLRATQTQASVRYVGFGQTVVSYNAYNQALQGEMSQTLFGDVQLVADYLNSPEETTERISLRWTW